MITLEKVFICGNNNSTTKTQFFFPFIHSKIFVYILEQPNVISFTAHSVHIDTCSYNNYKLVTKMRIEDMYKLVRVRKMHLYSVYFYFRKKNYLKNAILWKG